MIIDKTSLIIARKIKEIAPDHKSSVEVLEYGLKIIVNAAAIIVLTVIINLILGYGLTNVLMGALSFALLRSVSGGFHVRSSDLCVFLSVVILTFVQVISRLPMVNWLNVVTIVITLVLAPRDMQVQSRIPQRFNFMLKIICLTIVLINLFYIKSNIITAAFALQALTLLKKNIVEE